MFYFEELYNAKTSVKSLSVNSDKMIYSVISGGQTFIRYVATDGSSMILYSFDREADFVNCSVSTDFRVIHLTERIEKDGNQIYRMRIFDVQNPSVYSPLFECNNLIVANITRDDQYSIIVRYDFGITQYSIVFQNNMIQLNKQRKGINIKQVVWSFYSQKNDNLSIVKKYGDKYKFFYNACNDDTEFGIKQLEPYNPFFGFHFYSAQYHKTFCLIQQCFNNENGHSQFIVHFFPMKKLEMIILPNVSSDIRLNFFRYFSIIFAFIPNRYICVIDMKDQKIIILKKPFSTMPTSFMVSSYEDGLLCDDKEGKVYTTRINISCLNDPKKQREIETLAYFGARIQCWQYFYRAPQNDPENKTKSSSTYCTSTDPNKNEDGKSPMNVRKNKLSRRKEVKLKSASSSQTIMASIKNSLTYHPVVFENVEGNTMDLLSDKDNQEKVLINKVFVSTRRKSVINIPKISFDEEVLNSIIISNNNSTKLNPNKNPNTNHGNSLLCDGNDSLNTTNSLLNPMNDSKSQASNPITRATSYDVNYQKDHVTDVISHNQKMFDKIVVNKYVVATIFDFLKQPYQIISFIKDFIRLNGSGACDMSVPYTAMYSKEPYVFFIRVPKQTKQELMQIEDFFPTSSLMSRCQVFSCCVRTLMERRYVLSLSDAITRSLDIIRRQNSLTLNIREALSIWNSRSKLHRFCVIFALYSELALMNMPQIANLSTEIQEYSKIILPKIIREQLMIVGIYVTHAFGLNGNNADYWINRVDPKNVNMEKPKLWKKPQINVKPFKKRKIDYTKDTTRRVLRVARK
ncbi:hypothetical protein TRFO_18317 [Tritrichomonas foetus]|uniref:Uncharacterized protein n=1 Tax=Tritrichomonas foetus TaxID=1144522 RepID=A0A1J4KL47_9EUKA|nr:hypothetical protein TRFO_18317 [Tritrichomonas foetus]|eukprot:OHT12023.1 hypothetical protein TRFO_18317 [Tritrichomonas foetus]